jgi:hypothetical protein
MKRHILEITEIDCGDETCDECEYHDGGRYRCIRFDVPLWWNNEVSRRPTECLEAERAYKEHPFYDAESWRKAGEDFDRRIKEKGPIRA